MLLLSAATTFEASGTAGARMGSARRTFIGTNTALAEAAAESSRLPRLRQGRPRSRVGLRASVRSHGFARETHEGGGQEVEIL